MTPASFPFPVFMKNVFSVPSSSCDVIFHVDAELEPPPLAEDTLVFSGFRPRRLTTAKSSFMLDLVVRERASLNMNVSWW